MIIDVDEDGMTVLERLQVFCMRHGPFLPPPPPPPPRPPAGVPVAIGAVTSRRLSALAWHCPHCRGQHVTAPAYGRQACPSGGAVFLYGQRRDATIELQGAPLDVPSVRALRCDEPAAIEYDCPHCAAGISDPTDPAGAMGSLESFLARYRRTHEATAFGLSHCPVSGRPVFVQEFTKMPEQPRPEPPASRHDRIGDWTQRLQRSSSGQPKPSLHNAVLAFRYAPEFRDVLAFNQFLQVVEVTGRWPWQSDHDTFDQHTLTDHEVTEAVNWLQGTAQVLASDHTVLSALVLVAHDREYHPVRDYLSALRWDGVPRLDTWLVDHAGAEDTPYSRAVGGRFLIAMVARVFEPGCKVDTALVLEGPQGIYKSHVLDVLGGAWFTDYLPADLGSKDAMVQMNGSWLIELAEMASFKGSDIDRIKRFMSARQDQYRPPYGRNPVKIPRQCVFAGTINPDGAGYLKDATGDRRWWPVECAVGWEPRRKIDIEAFRQMRDVLLAEAVIRYRQGCPWWLAEGELEEQAREQADLRYDADVWTDRILGWAQRHASVTADQILESAMGMSLKDCDRGTQMRVAKILKKAGWVRGQVRKGDNWREKQWRYSNPNPPAESADVVSIRTDTPFDELFK